MKNITFAILTSLFLSVSLLAQEPETDKENKEAMRYLSFIVGEWKGDGWMMGADGRKHSFTQTETIQFKLDSTAILVEGQGKTGGKVIHDALAILTHNKSDNNYNFTSFLANGREGKFKAEILDGKLCWYPAENMRYIIKVNDQGQWIETGEMNRDGTWFQFFEMTLEKK